jgi:pimeloyl-ACP methyl ester carboxylesterase
MTTPRWFLETIKTPYTIKHVDVDGCTIEYQQWNKSGKPFLLFVHGNGGHANWWDFIAPSFIDTFTVCAIHLAGMGNSGQRSEYNFDSYAKDLIAVAADAGYSKDITIVGHSMGGVITMRAAENYPDRVKAIIVIDSPLIFKRSNDPSEQHKPPAPAHHEFSRKYYPDAETAFHRFRLVPAQECKNPFLVDHVGRHSIKQFPQGWGWKFDDGIYNHFKRSDRPPFDITRIHCPMAYLYGSDSALVPQIVVPDILELLKNKGPIYEIKGAHHHVMLDEPLQLIERLKEILKATPEAPSKVLPSATT